MGVKETAKKSFKNLFGTRIANALVRNDVASLDDLYEGMCNGEAEKWRTVGAKTLGLLANFLVESGYNKEPIEKYLIWYWMPIKENGDMPHEIYETYFASIILGDLLNERQHTLASFGFDHDAKLMELARMVINELLKETGRDKRYKEYLESKKGDIPK